jgi:hypothetical protein
MDSQPIVALGGPDDKNPCIFPSYQGIWLQRRVRSRLPPPAGSRERTPHRLDDDLGQAAGRAGGKLRHRLVAAHQQSFVDRVLGRPPRSAPAAQRWYSRATCASPPDPANPSRCGCRRMKHGPTSPTLCIAPVTATTPRYQHLCLLISPLPSRRKPQGRSVAVWESRQQARH